MARTRWDKASPDAELGDRQPAGDRRARRAAGTVAPLPGYDERQRHGWWRHRLAAGLGRPLGSPTDVRQKIEAGLLLFGAKPGQRAYPREAPMKELEAAEKPPSMSS
ncbi:MAG TPA: hypothetical protein VMG63_24410 [Terriglobia bacterium]|nr:hypothetical protein [Terriglobia bacterium]